MVMSINFDNTSNLASIHMTPSEKMHFTDGRRAWKRKNVVSNSYVEMDFSCAKYDLISHITWAKSEVAGI